MTNKQKIEELKGLLEDIKDFCDIAEESIKGEEYDNEDKLYSLEYAFNQIFTTTSYGCGIINKK